MAGHHRLERRGALALPPRLPARLVGAGRGPGRLLLQPRPRRRVRLRPALPDADHRRHLAGRRRPAVRAAAGRAVRHPVRPRQRPALVRRRLHHRLHHPLRGRPDHRDGALAAQPRRVDQVDAALHRRQHGRTGGLHLLPDGAAVDGVGGGLPPPRGRPDHPPRLGRHRPRPLPPDPHRRRQPGRRDALAARGHRVHGGDLRHPEAAHAVALPAGGVPAGDVVRARLLRRALRHRRHRRRAASRSRCWRSARSTNAAAGPSLSRRPDGSRGPGSPSRWTAARWGSPAPPASAGASRRRGSCRPPSPPGRRAPAAAAR